MTSIKVGDQGDTDLTGFFQCRALFLQVNSVKRVVVNRDTFRQVTRRGLGLS